MEEKTNNFSSLVKKRIVVNDFRKIAYTRLNSQYERPHKLAKLIIKNIGLQSFNYQRTKFIVPFFVKMWDLWEKFLGNLFENYYDDSVRVRQQDSHSAWLIHGESHPIKPDLVLYQNGKISLDNQTRLILRLTMNSKEAI